MQQKLQRPAAPAQHGSEIAEASWEDLRVFLVCADSGSFRKAAEIMGVTNTTVMRVLDRLETRLGFKLFVRHQTGLQPTDEARGIVEDVRQTYPCFRDEFIHPNDLVALMADAVPSMGLRGFAAPAPFRGTR